jgi:p-cumate 2,3-dioxygenase beta subunit
MDETLKLRLRVEDLLFEEADLLDQWKLNDWLALYTEDAHYHVPPSDVDGDTATPESALFYIMDDSVRMRERVVRLSKIGAHSEHPKSKVRHLVTNIRARREGDLIRARSSFIVSRAKDITHDLFVGHYLHEIVEAEWRAENRQENMRAGYGGTAPPCPDQHHPLRRGYDNPPHPFRAARLLPVALPRSGQERRLLS